MGAEGPGGAGGLALPALGGEGQLLLSGVSGNGGGRGHGAGGEQHGADLDELLAAVARQAYRTADRDLGQCTGAWWGGAAAVPAHAHPAVAPGAAAGLQP